MTLEKFYTNMNVDYQNVLDRLMKESRILRYLQMMIDDHTIVSLEKAIESKQYKEAFSLAHTIKGICENLELASVLAVLRPLVEDLRSGDPQTLPGSFYELKDRYHKTIEQIKSIELGG